MRTTTLKKTFVALLAGLLSSLWFSAQAVAADAFENTFRAPLTDATNLSVNGPHRFVTIAGLTGFQPTSVHTKTYIETDLHQGEQGTLSFWFSSLEALDFFPRTGRPPNVGGNPYVYPFISDVYPANNIARTRFGVLWNPGDPQILAKFTDGEIWEKMDYVLPPFAMIEKLPLRPGSWYHVVLTWNQEAGSIDLYVNGLLMGYNHRADEFAESGQRLYLGSPMFVMREVTLSDRAMEAEAIRAAYAEHRPDANGAADADLARLTTPAYGSPSVFVLDASWKKAFDCPFTRQSDLEGWRTQTDPSVLDRTTVEITPEGLLFATPDEIGVAPRATLWGPRTFEGDQCLDVEFRLESPEGLALVVLCASGMAREDFLADHELQMTGSMGPILSGTRNYHWEFMRRVNVIRTDVETQAVYKNPWRHLYYGMIPKLEQNRWYRLRLVKIGNRLQGSLDGNIVFDVEDDPHANNGPAYNFGRIALRHMYSTTIRYRNLVVHERGL